MKKDKWLKWKVGAVLSLGIAGLFHEIKTSTAFQQASANATSTDNTVAAGTNEQDPVMDDSTWQSFFNGDNAHDGSSSGHDNASSQNIGPGSGSDSSIGSGSSTNSGSGSFLSDNSSGQSFAPQGSTHTRTRRS